MRTMYKLLLLLVILIPCYGTLNSEYKTDIDVDCSTLRMGQYLCPDPSYDLIDPKTQQIRGCRKGNTATVRCIAVNGLRCNETKNGTFTKEMPCVWTNGYYFDTALILSIFLGMFGIDRLYLGYTAIGLAKFCTFGFMFVGQLIDIILIATQIVGPADGSAYIMPYFGPGVEVIRSDNWTYRYSPEDRW